MIMVVNSDYENLIYDDESGEDRDGVLDTLIWDVYEDNFGAHDKIFDIVQDNGVDD